MDEDYECDCTYDGNTQYIGPKCRERIDQEWSRAIAASRELAYRFRESDIQACRVQDAFNKLKEQVDDDNDVE